MVDRLHGYGKREVVARGKRQADGEGMWVCKTVLRERQQSHSE